MVLRLPLSVIFVALLATPAALGQSYPAAFSKDCVLDQNDPYDLGWRFPDRTRSPYRGQCIDTSQKRPPLVLKADASGITFANFFYKDRYYTASIPAGAVEKIYFQIAEFDKVLGVIQPAHTQLRFQLRADRPALLTPQFRGGRQVLISNFVYSTDYMAPAGVPYDALRGMREIFMNMGRFVAIEDRVKWQVVTNQNTVRQFELNISGHHLDQVLWASIGNAADRSTKDVYSTISMNCTTEAFRVLYLGLQRPVPNRPWYPTSLFSPVTPSSINRLKSMGLIDHRSERATMNEEFAHLAPRAN